MNPLDVIDEHIIIRETIGYDGIKEVDVVDMPTVLQFLKVIHNYIKIKNINERT